MYLDFKVLAKWLFIAQIVSLVIFPFLGSKGLGFSAASLVFTGMFWGTFAADGVAWLWFILMFAGPVATYLVKDKNDMNSWIIKTSATFCSFLGALLYGIICSDIASFGTWIFLAFSVALLAIFVIEGQPYYNKK